MKTIPNCLCPATVVVVDDDLHYLDALKMILPQEESSYLFFDKTDKALDYLDAISMNKEFFQKWLAALDTQAFEHHVLDINIKDLYKEVFNKNRFEQISTVLVDYDMPGMTGLDFCMKIKNPYIQKIMITGAADEHLAVDAFNRRIIDGFIRKQHPNFLGLIQETVKSAHCNYFSKLMHVATTAINLQNKQINALEDPVFMDVFNGIVQDHKIVEYYQIESTGSFLMMDADGRDYTLFVYNEDKLAADYLELSEDLEDELDPTLKEAVLKKEKILCYHNFDKNTYLPVSEWHQYLLDAHKVKGQEVYYYGFRENCVGLDKENIVSFNAYKMNKKV